jgi:hypothetical protein
LFLFRYFYFYLSGTVFDFIVQANLQVASPNSKKIRLKDVTLELFQQLENVMDVLKEYYPTEQSQLAIITDCNEKLKKREIDFEAVNHPTTLAAVGKKKKNFKN